MTYLKGQGSGLLKFKGQGPEMVNVAVRFHAHLPTVDVAALLQLTAWVEKLDAINHMNSGEDQVIINIRSQAVGVLDAWTKRWYSKHAMSDDAQR